MNSHPDISKTNRLLRGILVAGIVLILGVILAYTFRRKILTGVAEFLIVEDRDLQTAEMIFLLNGDYNTRPFLASELYREGYAPLIGIAQSEVRTAEEMGLAPNETAVAIKEMGNLGVPFENIVLLSTEGEVTSTFDEAVALRQYVEANEVHSIIVVTSSFHTRRAKWICERELAGLDVTLQVAATPYENFDAENWWRSEEGLITLNNEYLKLIYYYWKYR